MQEIVEKRQTQVGSLSRMILYSATTKAVKFSLVCLYEQICSLYSHYRRPCIGKKQGFEFHTFSYCSYGTTYHFTCDSAQALSAESGSKTLRPFGGHSGAHGFTVSPCFTFENQGRVLPAGTAGRLYTRSDLALSQATYTDGGLHTKTD